MSDRWTLQPSKRSCRKSPARRPVKAARANTSRTFKHRFSHGDDEFLATAADGGILTARFRLIATRRRSGKVSGFETISRLEVMALKIADLQS
jgi:hypothetical protein